MRSKRWTLVSAAAMAAAAVSTLLSPAGPAGPAGAGPDSQEVAATTSGPIEEHTTAVLYGPFDVPAATEDGPSMLSNAIVREGGCRTLDFCLDRPVEKPCENCYITGIVPDLIDPATGESLNITDGAMLHHTVSLNWSKPDTTCAPGFDNGIIGVFGALEGGNQRTFATGNERTITDAPRGYGMKVEPGDEWGLIVDLMNMRPEPRQMALRYTYTWTEAELKPLTPVWLDIDNCGDSEVDLPSGYTDTDWDWTSTISGNVVGIGGHVHDHGISIAAENATKGQKICASRAGYERGSDSVPVGPGTGSDGLHPARWRELNHSDHPDVSLESYDGRISSMTRCVWGKGKKIAEGDTIRLHTQYNLPEAHDGDHAGHGAMGIMIAYVHET